MLPGCHNSHLSMFDASVYPTKLRNGINRCMRYSMQFDVLVNLPCMMALWCSLIRRQDNYVARVSQQSLVNEALSVYH